MKKALMALMVVATTMVGLIACQQGPEPTTYAPYFDGVFQPQSADKTRHISGDVLEISHGMVSDVNERFQMEDPTITYGAALSDDGSIIDGKFMVLHVHFVDSGDSKIETSFNTAVTLRLQINAKNEITKGVLRGKPNSALGVLFGSDSAGKLLNGKAYIMYRDEEVAMGQIQAEFDGFKINANFRALAYRR